MLASAPLRSLPIRSCLAVGLLTAFGLLGCGGSGGSEGRAARAIEEGRVQEAWTLAGAAVAADSASAEAWIQLGRAGLRTFRTSLGLEAVNRAVALDSTREDAHLVRAYLLQRCFRNVAANLAADRAAQLAPKDVRAHVACGEMHLGGGAVGTADYDAAAASFREAVKLDSKDLRAQLGLAKTLILKAENEDEAAALLESVLAARPFHGEALYFRGLVRMRNREMEPAAADFERAVSMLPDAAAARFNWARVLDRLGKPEAAAAARKDYPHLRLQTEMVRFQELRYHEHEDLGVGLQLVAALRDGARFDEAAALAETLTLDFPHSAPAHLELADCAMKSGRPEVAARAAARAAELAPGDARAQASVVTANLAAGNTAQAIALADSAQDRDHPDVVLALAETQLAAGKSQDAIRTLRQHGGLTSPDPRIHALLGRSLLAAGRHENAARALDKAIAARPREAVWLEARAQAYLADGRAGVAEEDFRAALEIEPHRLASLEALAELLANSERSEEAKAVRATRDRARDANAAILAAQEEWRARPGDLALTRKLADLLGAAGREAEAARVWLIAEPEFVEP